LREARPFFQNCHSFAATRLNKNALATIRRGNLNEDDSPRPKDDLSLIISVHFFYISQGRVRVPETLVLVSEEEKWIEGKSKKDFLHILPNFGHLFDDPVHSATNFYSICKI